MRLVEYRTGRYEPKDLENAAMSDEVIELATGTDELLCRIEQRVGVVTLNKPHKKNALGDILTPALRSILLVLEADPRVGCVMLTGAGDAFCSGGDVSGMGGGGGEGRQKTPAEAVTELTHKQETLTLRLHELAKPTIAALPGAAAGAGLSIALACDLRVAARRAFITTAFRNIGLSGDYGASWFLTRLVGLAQAKELMFTAERLSAADCVAMGLVNKVYDDDTFRADALAYAAHIANGPGTALRMMKLNLNRGIAQGLRESLAMEAEHLIACSGTEESREAVRAFMEKRPPRFNQAL
jgi:enoyl-CoA hydratase/carnithine racemase